MLGLGPWLLATSFLLEWPPCYQLPALPAVLCPLPLSQALQLRMQYLMHCMTLIHCFQTVKPVSLICILWLPWF